MTDQKKRPTGIHIENCDDVTLTNNTGIGDMDFIVTKNSKNIKGSGNEYITPDQRTVLPSKKWYEKPFGIILISVASILIAGFLLYYFGWN